MKHENMAITSARIIGITSAFTTYALRLKHNILHIWSVLTYLTYIVNTIIPSYNKIIDINIFPYNFGLPVLQGKHFLSDLRKLTAVSESLSSSLRKYSVLRENHYYKTIMVQAVRIDLADHAFSESEGTSDWVMICFLG